MSSESILGNINNPTAISRKYLHQGIRDAYEGNVGRMELVDPENPLQLPLRALAQRINIERECVSQDPDLNKIIIGGKYAETLEDQVSEETAGLRFGDYRFEIDENDSTYGTGTRLADRGDFVNLLFIAARTEPDDEIQKQMPTLVSTSLGNYAKRLEQKASVDQSNSDELLRKANIARKASLRLQQD